MAAYVDYNPTMATASMTMASHSVDHNPSVTSSTIDHYVESREESIEKLKVALIRYARGNDRRMVLRTLKNVSFLSYIPLEPARNRGGLSMSELEKEVFMERLLLNGTTLNPPSKSTTPKNAGTNSGSLVILKGISRALCENSPLDAKALYDRLVFRLSKSLVASEVFAHLNSVFGSSEVIVKQLDSDNSARSNSANTTEPNDLQLYNTGGQVHMTLDTRMNFGLFRKIDDPSASRPWILMECKVHERANLCTNESFRGLSVKTPEIYC